MANYWIVLGILLVGMVLSVKAGKLNRTGALTGGLVGWAIFLGAGFTGLAMLGIFFGLGSLVTSWKVGYKRELGLAEANKGRRTAGQVLANGGMAGLLGLLGWQFPQHGELVTFVMAASFASATGDTFSSELGNVYGSRFYNILTFRADSRGLDGVVSLEGTLLGMLGSLIIAGLYAIGAGWTDKVVWVFMAGIVGNLFDSILGATLERKGYVKNDVVNFLNTFLAALVALLLHSIVSMQ